MKPSSHSIAPPRSPRRQWIEWAVVCAFWMLIAIMIVLNRILDPRWELSELTEGAWRLLVGPFIWVLPWVILTPLIFRVSERFPIEREVWPKRALTHIGIALCFAIPVDMFSDYLNMWQYEPLRDADSPPNTYSAIDNVLQIRFWMDVVIYSVALTAGFARDYFYRYQDHQVESLNLRAHSSALEAQLSEARLQALRMQLNPHFLFNTLHAISSLVERDPRGVRSMVARLSSILRYSLDKGDQQLATVHQEMNILGQYLDIQQIRFQGRLQVNQDIAPELHSALIPTLILQPLVENAIKHGISKVKADGELTIRGWIVMPLVHFTIEDNGPGLSDAYLSEGDGAPVLDPNAYKGGVGLSNTRARLEARYGSIYKLELRPREGGGTVTHIALPYASTSDLITHAVPVDA